MKTRLAVKYGGVLRAGVAALSLLTAFPARADLPPEVEADRLLLVARGNISSGSWHSARKALEDILALGIAVPGEFYYHYGYVLSKADEPELAHQALATFLQSADRSSDIYREALQLINQMESDAYIKKFQLEIQQRKDVESVTRLAESGDADGQARLAYWHRTGEHGVAEDAAAAHKWYLLAARQGHASAQFNLGVMYDQGAAVAKDPVAAADWYRKAAGQGHKSAQYWLGMKYEMGQGVPQDLALAHKWYAAAAGQGLDVAQYQLAMLYAQGAGVPMDMEEARLLLEQAAAQGHQDAATALAELAGGADPNQAAPVPTVAPSVATTPVATASAAVSVPADPLVAERARAEAGDAEAQYRLARRYIVGEGVPLDAAQALAWYERAAEGGHLMAQKILGSQYDQGDDLVQQDDVKSIAWFLLAAAQGDAESQYNAGIMLYNGRGTQADHAAARGWYEKAAAQGIVEAQYNLGLMLYQGEGGPADEATAVAWLQKAADQGYANAREALDVIASY